MNERPRPVVIAFPRRRRRSLATRLGALAVACLPAIVLIAIMVGWAFILTARPW